MIIDEIGTSKEVTAAKSIAHRGVVLVGGWVLRRALWLVVPMKGRCAQARMGRCPAVCPLSSL